MPDPLVTRRELLIWLACFLFVSVLLVLTGFASDDPDSALYAELSARLARLPIARWIAPEWWGQWQSEGWFREHPAGVFLVPTALGALGIPTIQAAYIVGIAAGLASLLMIGVLTARMTTREDGRAVLVLLQLMPVAFLFRIRANHEYPMLVCLLVTLIGLERVRASWWWVGAVAAGLTAALLVKGVFVVLILVAAGWWVLLNPTRATGSIARPIVAVVVGLAVMAGTAAIYDLWYQRMTGEPFWGPYWQRQLGPLEIATPLDGASTLGWHALFYATRLLWHPAPWSLVLVAAAWRYRRSLGTWWRAAPDGAQRGLLFALLFAFTAVAILMPSSRFAERYAFSATYALAAAGAVVAYRAWPAVRRGVTRLESLVIALPAVVWLGLMLVRLIVGPFLPRI